MTHFDYIIIGAGPSGLAFAQCCASVNKTVLIIEKEDTIGGLHRVRRVDGMFSEHGPRIYSSSYLVFKELLQQMGENFDDHFTPYDFQMLNIGGQSITQLSIRELGLLSLAFLRLVISNEYGKDISMSDWMEYHNFSSASRDYIDRACRLTDGATIERYSLFKFLSIVNQQALYGLYQPKKPNDLGFLKTWKNYLLNTGLVKFQMNTTIDSISHSNGFVNSITDTVGEIYSAQRFVFSIPPTSLLGLLKDSGFSTSKFQKFAKQTEYITYISICFHWDKQLDLSKVWGFPSSDWGVVFIVLSDYMSFSGKTVISTAITRTDVKSKNSGKTANESTQEELIAETFKQLQISFPELLFPSDSILSPSIYHDGDSWKDSDNAFVNTSEHSGLPFRLVSSLDNLFSVGTHNGKEKYHFTSLESAVTNSVALAHTLHPETRHKFKIHAPVEVVELVRVVIILLMIMWIISR